MIPDGIKNRFELYQKWFKTLLIEEYLNLPIKSQEKFMTLVKDFTKSCEKIHEESKVIKEREIKLTIVEILPVFNRDEKYRIYCQSSELQNKVIMPVYQVSPEPKIGDKINCTVFSIEGDVWYSSKEELVSKLKS